MLLPESIQSLVTALERLPGIGPKSASRLAFHLLRAPEDLAQDLSVALANLKVNTAFCQECFNITDAGRERCEICESSKRDGSLICVVEEALDVWRSNVRADSTASITSCREFCLPSRALVPTI